MSATRHLFKDSGYLALPGEFYAAAEAHPAPAPRWIVFNQALAEELGLPPDAATPDLLRQLAGGAPPEGRKNLALAYAGHQFGQWNPRMGDGRAVLIGEIEAPDGKFHDVHLKGSGPTVFARRGDGRATLPAMLREYIVSEAMAGLDISSTRSLAVVATGAQVFRDAPHHGAVLTRIARSHVRVGTFQYAAQGDAGQQQGPLLTRALADHCIARDYPEIAGTPEPYAAFFAAVVERQARLIAQWMLAGFIHGVMNTDNMAISGETIDFGPCAFMDAFNSRQVFSSIDSAGRYAYSRQPSVAMWNLARLAEALLPLLGNDEASALRLAQEKLEGFRSVYAAAFAEGMERKLGLTPGDARNAEFIERLWPTMEHGRADFTLFFRRLTQIAAGADEAGFLALFAGGEPQAHGQEAAFLAQWRELTADRDPALRLADMQASNPIVIARNHRVEQALERAAEGDLGLLERLSAALKNPFAEPAPGPEDLEAPPKPDERVTETFCGT
ncbi:YdiU family protein [uncultured Rhodoblastus sp.]|uniref:protein adenylyltransferase SelO n=1 Tax=uncultured Rhodoblastus sp. TaxID=543037 RepID=UPI0025E8A932|nr:YdiU family protein [uncultured Rhodoblastus sp.]